MSLFQDEKNKLFNNFLQRYFKNANACELIISPECNQACEYCYLFKHGHHLYPENTKNKDNILNNIILLLDYLKQEEFTFTHLDLFSGEFFQLSFWENIFDILYNHSLVHDILITIPSNFSFVLDDEQANKIEKWIHLFKDVKNVDIFLSCSVDGPETLEELERPIKNHPGIKQQDFYHKMFTFLSKNQFVAHPMITKNFVMNYKENYDFWIDNIIKYNCTVKKNGVMIYSIPMFLEVRDPDQWDDPEVLEKYREFLLYVAEKDLYSYHEGNIEEFALHIADDFTDGMASLGRYNKTQPYIIGIPEIYSAIPCSIQSGMKCRVGDLSIVPCHRTCYPNMIYGQFIVDSENNKIIGVQGDKVSLAHKIQNCNPNRSFSRCSDCNLKAICLKGCLGSQYEHTGELFGAQDNVCNMFKVKYKTIHEICEKYGVYDIITNNISIPVKRREHINYVRKLISQL
jgi:sulfatase maturation enzyme AslB (radical SAM superfamily)